jgi:hypothetical protein
MKITSVSLEIEWDKYLSGDTLRLSDYWCGVNPLEQQQAGVCHVLMAKYLWWASLGCFLLLALCISGYCRRSYYSTNPASGGAGGAGLPFNSQPTNLSPVMVTAARQPTSGQDNVSGCITNHHHTD